MRPILFSLFTVILSICNATAQTTDQDSSDIVVFLEGKWHNYSYFVSDGKPVTKQDYKETMHIKNDTVLTITAHNFKDGENLTHDMILINKQDSIVMQQGNFKATGIREGNVYYLKGFAQGKEYRFRLYTMGDKYIFHNEVWQDGKIEMMNMSYLIRE